MDIMANIAPFGGYLLPLMKSKDQSVAGLIIKQRAPDKVEGSEDQDDSSASIHSCAEEIMRAIHAKDIKALAEALKDAFTILDSEPHVEGEHIEPHSYDAQNIKAGKE